MTPSQDHRFIFICQRIHVEAFQLDQKLKTWAPGCEVVQIDELTEGAACTVLVAREFIENNDHLMIANCDQYIEIDIDQYLQKLSAHDLDGLIMTMKADDPKWSYVAIDENRNVTRVVEKEVISDEATVGIYNFKHGIQFVSAAEKMIEDDFRVNGEFYVAPTYNVMIERGGSIGIDNIGTEGNGMYGLGIPSDLERFLTLPVLSKALRVLT